MAQSATTTMTARLTGVQAPGPVLRGFYAIGKHIFGQVPTPETLMARRPTLMLGLGALYGAIEWGGTVEASLRALLNLQVARLYAVPY